MSRAISEQSIEEHMERTEQSLYNLIKMSSFLMTQFKNVCSTLINYFFLNFLKIICVFSNLECKLKLESLLTLSNILKFTFNFWLFLGKKNSSNAAEFWWMATSPVKLNKRNALVP